MEEKYLDNARYMLESSKTRLCEGIELNDDYNLPDYINDIKKLVRCDTTQVLHNAFSKGNTMQCEGEVLFSFLCICEDNSILNIIYSSSFTVNTPYKENSADNIYIYCKAENPQARLTSPRKVNFKCRLNIFADETQKEEVKPRINDDDSLVINEKIEIIKSMKCDVQRELNMHASHDIEISSDIPEITNIVYCSVSTYINEIKAVESKLSLRGESLVKLLYEGNNGEYISLCESFAFSEFLENEYPDTAVCLCDVTVKDIKAAVQNNSFGEMRIIELDFSYDLEHKHYYNTDTEILCDVYATDCELNCEKKELEYNSFVEAFSSALSVTELKDIPDYNDYLPYEVVDCFAQIESNELRFDDQKNKYLLSGNIKWNILCKCAENEKYYPFTMTSPFKYEKDRYGDSFELYEEHCVKLIKANAEVDKDKISLNAEIYINEVIASREKNQTICAISVSDEKIKERSPITLYYPKTEDTLWDVAKKYKCKCEDIIETNNLKNEDISQIKVLLIPKHK